MVLIAAAGKIGSGKSTLAKYLVDNYNFVEVSFAEPLKRACQELFLLSDQQLYGTQQDKANPDQRWYNCSPRELLQFVGTDLLRDQMQKIIPELGLNIFVKRMELWYLEEIKNNPDTNVVIADLRFPNEMEFVERVGGISIQINRFEENINNNTHISESALHGAKFDFEIENTLDLENFYRQIDGICALLLNGISS